MRRYGIPEPYEKLKALTRGQAVTKELCTSLLRRLKYRTPRSKRLTELTPEKYVGLAAELASQI